MVMMLATATIVAILVFIYFNRYLARRRDERREHMYQKQQELLEKILEVNKNKKEESIEE